jgi:hypothetical protein
MIELLEWCYLEAMMLRLVFNVGSVSLVMKMITTVPFSVFLMGRHKNLSNLCTV